MTDGYAYHRSYLCVKSYRESRARARPHTKFKRRVLYFRTNTYRVYIPLKPPILIPSDNTALRIRDLITPSDYSILLTPRVATGGLLQTEEVWRWAKTPFLLLHLLYFLFDTAQFKKSHQTSWRDGSAYSLE
jgi:hypothetical protein